MRGLENDDVTSSPMRGLENAWGMDIRQTDKQTDTQTNLINKIPNQKFTFLTS